MSDGVANPIPLWLDEKLMLVSEERV